MGIGGVIMETTDNKIIELKKETEFKLVPLYNPHAILRNWQYLIEGVEKVLNHTCGSESYEKILNELLSGQLLMWIGFIDGAYVGFITTRVDNVPIAEMAKVKRYLSIPQLYIKNGTDQEVFIKGFEAIKEYAKKIGCQQIRMWAKRKGWEKRLTKLGWSPSYIEYNLEVN